MALKALDGCRFASAGQGMNRVQQAPNVSKAIHNILWRCQQKIGSWVGSSVRGHSLVPPYDGCRPGHVCWPQTGGWPRDLCVRGSKWQWLFCAQVDVCMGSIRWRSVCRCAETFERQVVHLGDHNVPNALMFIDKYQQVRTANMTPESR